jgi:hypothetical protein
MTKELIEKSKSMFLNGMSITQIGKELEINRKIVSKYLKREGVNTKQRYDSYNIDTLIQVSKLLDEGWSLQKVATELKLHRRYLAKKLNKAELRELDKADAPNKYDYASEFIKNIAEDYNNGLSFYALVKKYKVSRDTIYEAVKANGMIIDSLRTTRNKEVDETIFKQIDTEHKAYWLGFLMADGYISQDRGLLELALKHEDFEHIQKFKEFMKCDHEIKERVSTLKGKQFKSNRITICSKIIANDLARLGCVQAKSLILKFPYIKEDLIHHFMRGYFDGDGSVFKPKNGSPSCSVIGTLEFLDVYESHICDLGMGKTKYSKKGKAYQARHSGSKNVEKMYEYFYKDSSIYLKRKRNVFIAVLGRDA